jgi:hypothetical protein
MLEIIDGLIATITVVLVLSLIVQAIQQIIKQAWSFKSKYMEQELLAMFLQVKTSDSKSYFGQSPVQRSLKALWDFLIPARGQFKKAITDPVNANVVAVLDMVKGKLSSVGYDDISLLETMKSGDFVKVLEGISAGLPAELKTKLDSTVSKAIEDARQWYDLTLKAFQDHYERRMKIWSYVLSGLVVIWLNANLFEIYKEFSTNKVLRDAAIQMGAQLTSIPRDSLVGVNKGVNRDSVQVIVDSLAFKAIQRNIAQIDSLVHLKSFQIMRWDSAKGAPMHFRDTCGVAPGLAIRDFIAGTKNNWPGWLAMTLLVGLGAPFWYDFLKAVMGLKETLKGKKQGS